MFSLLCGVFFVVLPSSKIRLFVLSFTGLLIVGGPRNSVIDMQFLTGMKMVSTWVQLLILRNVLAHKYLS